MSNEIPSNRKLAYYGGRIVTVCGFLLFASTFVTFFHLFNSGPNATGMQEFQSIGSGMMLRAFAGAALIAAGGFISRIGARGLAGSGMILNPGKAREELKPYSRMAGGMIKDALNEADVQIGGSSRTVIMMKCKECGKLNEEDSKFCQECDKEL